ncbi:MAG TPA: hypothetical protein PK600_05390, partial [Deltaproteobacteria bacterium]|nr:hypothetical protein [Deltaproteobacteria bacterium]
LHCVSLCERPVHTRSSSRREKPDLFSSVFPPSGGKTELKRLYQEARRSPPCADIPGPEKLLYEDPSPLLAMSPVSLEGIARAGSA